MKRFGDFYAKIWFWIENLVYIIGFLLYEIMLIPLIYVKVFYNLLIATSFFNFLLIGPFWVLVGPTILFFYSMKDTFYFIRILCDYGDEDQQDEKLYEIDKQDKIVIYNEILEVMTSIMFISRMKKKQFDQEKLKSKNMNPDMEQKEISYSLVTLDLIVKSWMKIREETTKDDSFENEAPTDLEFEKFLG